MSIFNAKACVDLYSWSIYVDPVLAQKHKTLSWTQSNDFASLNCRFEANLDRNNPLFP